MMSSCLVSDPSPVLVHSMLRSRRLLFVLSPDFLAEKSFSLLECHLGLDLQRAGRVCVVTVTYSSISKLRCQEVARLRQAASSAMTWRGKRSEPQRSRFWLRLRLALPIRPITMGRRLIDSASSHSDLASLELLGAQILTAPARSSVATTQAASNHSHRRVPPRARGMTATKPQNSKDCSACFGFVTAPQCRIQTQSLNSSHHAHYSAHVEHCPANSSNHAASDSDSTHIDHSNPNPSNHLHCSSNCAHNNPWKLISVQTD
ncbi:uncharacterized protein LOC129190844 [Dunckerocampus dactyliophorus]|uniref:uncharacterized protein LOC129190844 n=1 Tax=Dunckerocampus dactyliophorus TaxID=161453 RepID=UPI002406C493|nr:uncharacterized protein LOC129190844 [Dunckerocampus dactyliophorus]